MNRKRIYYEDTGTGQAVLLIHGLGGSARYWGLTTEALSTDLRVVALDLPGFGRSDPPGHRMTASDYVEVLDFVITELKLGLVHVIGFSMGSLIAYLYATMFPLKVAKMVLVSPIGLPGTAFPVYFYIPGLTASLKIGAYLAVKQTLAFPVIFLAFARPNQVSDETFGLMRTSAREMRLAHRGLLTCHNTGACGIVKCPTLVMWGARDRILPRPKPATYSKYFAHVGFTVYPQAGHVPMLETPNEFNRDVLAFINEEQYSY